MIAPKRNDSIYLEIESFKDYELTQCVAYEMAIRTPEIQEILIGKSYIDKDSKESEVGVLYPTDKNKEIMRIFREHGLEISTVLSPQRKNHTGNVQSYFWKCTPIGMMKVSSMYAKEGVSGIKVNGHSLFTGTPDKVSFQNTPEVEILMSRPALKFDTPNRALVNINFDLPMEDIIAQVKHIKDISLQDNKAISSPLDVYNDLIYAGVSEYAKKPKAQKLADWFFTYDLYQILKAQRNPELFDEGIFQKIDYQLQDYHQKTNARHYSNETYRKTILPTMQNFIENGVYRELFTQI